MTSRFKAAISINGMSCSSCSNTVQNVLEAISVDGNLTPDENNYRISTANVVVSLLTTSPTLDIIFTSKNYVSDDFIKEKATETIMTELNTSGFDCSILSIDRSHVSTEAMVNVKINIAGMTCSSCSNTIENHLMDVYNESNTI